MTRQTAPESRISTGFSDQARIPARHERGTPSAQNQTIQPTVTIGNNVMIWSGNHLGHGTAIKDHVSFYDEITVAMTPLSLGFRCAKTVR